MKVAMQEKLFMKVAMQEKLFMMVAMQDKLDNLQIQTIWNRFSFGNLIS